MNGTFVFHIHKQYTHAMQSGHHKTIVFCSLDSIELGHLCVRFVVRDKQAVSHRIE